MSDPAPGNPSRPKRTAKPRGGGTRTLGEALADACERHTLRIASDAVRVPIGASLEDYLVLTAEALARFLADPGECAQWIAEATFLDYDYLTLSRDEIAALAFLARGDSRAPHPKFWQRLPTHRGDRTERSSPRVCAVLTRLLEELYKFEWHFVEFWDRERPDEERLHAQPHEPNQMQLDLNAQSHGPGGEGGQYGVFWDSAPFDRLRVTLAELTALLAPENLPPEPLGTIRFAPAPERPAPKPMPSVEVEAIEKAGKIKKRRQTVDAAKRYPSLREASAELGVPLTTLKRWCDAEGVKFGAQGYARDQEGYARPIQ